MKLDTELQAERARALSGISILSLALSVGVVLVTMGLGGAPFLAFGLAIIISVLFWLAGGMVISKAMLDKQERLDADRAAARAKMARSDLDRLPREGV